MKMNEFETKATMADFKVQLEGEHFKQKKKQKKYYDYSFFLFWINHVSLQRYK
jgi:hypothetical protein